MRRRRRGGRRALWAILLVAGGSLVVWKLMGNGGDDAGPDGPEAPGEAMATTDDDLDRLLGETAEPEGGANEEQTATPTLVQAAPGGDDAARPPAPTAPAVSPEDTPPAGGEEPAATVAMGGEVPTAAETLGRPESLAGPGPSPDADGAASPTLRAILREGEALLASGQPVRARRHLSTALRGGVLEEAEAAMVRAQLMRINERLVFSPEIVSGDPFTKEYVVQSGDSLAGIVTRMGLQIDWRLIQRINLIEKPSRIRAGQRLKLITGPFHAVVDKRDFRLDLYLGEPGRDDTPATLVYVRSFPVGTGEWDSTPTGMFRVRPESKLIDPTWVNPRTGERFAAEDPENPIGDYWIGLEGIDETNRSLRGYGIHGTIDPDSIGAEASMGCVRMRDDDVAILYECLIEGYSQVQIVADY
ncbi:MAG: L,D-transpeptidase family protein [Planctomycetota bacterium]|jgi:LysM repeat protein